MNTNTNENEKKEDGAKKEQELMETPKPYVNNSNTDVKINSVRLDISKVDRKEHDDDLSAWMIHHRSLGMITTKSGEQLIGSYVDVKVVVVVVASAVQQAAGRQVFSSLMTNAWRKCSGDVILLRKQVEVQDRLFNKKKDDLKYYTALFQCQQKCTDDLTANLKDLVQDFKAKKLTHKQLTEDIDALKAEQVYLQKQIELQDEEYKRVKGDFQSAAHELFAVHRRYEEMCGEWLSSTGQIAKQQLINKWLKAEAENIAGIFKQKIAACQAELKADESAMISEVHKITHELLYLKHQKQEIRNTWMLTECQLARTLQSKRDEAKSLNAKLDNLPSVKLMKLWKKVMTYRAPIAWLLHWLASVLVPVVPQPKITSCIGQERAIMKVAKK